MPRQLGLIPSPPDERDYPLESILYAGAGPFPPRLVGPLPPRVLDQGGTSECVAYATSAGRAASWRLHRGDDIDLCPHWLYEAAQAIDGIEGPHDGTTPRAALKIASKIGIPTLCDGADAEQHRIVSYWRLGSLSVSSIQMAIATYGGLLLAVDWQGEWDGDLTDGVLPDGGTSRGGHAIYAVGYDLEVAGGSLIIQNSWGEDFGIAIPESRASGGFAYLPFSQMGYVWEAWKTLSDIDVTPPAAPARGCAVSLVRAFARPRP